MKEDVWLKFPDALRPYIPEFVRDFLLLEPSVECARLLAGEVVGILARLILENSAVWDWDGL